MNANLKYFNQQGGKNNNNKTKHKDAVPQCTFSVFLKLSRLAEFFKEHIFSQQCSDRCPSLFQQKDVVESRHLCTMEQMIAMIDERSHSSNVLSEQFLNNEATLCRNWYICNLTPLLSQSGILLSEIYTSVQMHLFWLHFL